MQLHVDSAECRKRHARLAMRRSEHKTADPGYPSENDAGTARYGSYILNGKHFPGPSLCFFGMTGATPTQHEDRDVPILSEHRPGTHPSHRAATDHTPATGPVASPSPFDEPDGRNPCGSDDEYLPSESDESDDYLAHGNDDEYLPSESDESDDYLAPESDDDYLPHGRDKKSRRDTLKRHRNKGCPKVPKGRERKTS
ncbi:hypothetical protein AURDEDRAFT_166415 [Auricularia subglabra TFB-10046 SS5]|uniref:Uncharacterized protein n=1 Tax=Auricularia subglabra (strain TFB-10046 / SS5) TaxID=717982 RepID=J0DDW3_AURST|nr:hypothetical protein AURDEDRAFT_166415 [Auricularia subglabra TFB-10046 SS5]